MTGNRWISMNSLPDEIVPIVPEYVAHTFREAVRTKFTVETVPPLVSAAPVVRPNRRLVVIADAGDMGTPSLGPMGYPLGTLQKDFVETHRVYIIPSMASFAVIIAAYEAACRDLDKHSDVAVIVETTPEWEQSWTTTAIAMRSSSFSIHPTSCGN